jgi:Mg2+ and Co2+ transporter CorA
MDEPAEASKPILSETFGFHPLAVEDALQEVHVPKLDDWGQYLYLVLHAIDFDQHNGGGVNTSELDVFLGHNYIVTYHKQPIVAVDRLWKVCRRDERHLKRGADHLLYRLADELVASYLPVIEGMDETLITTLFMPMSFVVGFFGMNFFQAVSPLEAWTAMPAFILVIAIMILTPFSMYLWVRRRAWM